MKPTRTLATWVALLLLLPACEQLGNPPMRRGRTETEVWRGGGLQLATSSQTFPSENASEVLRSLPRHQLQQVEPFPPVGAAVTLVAVEVGNARIPIPYTLRFVTLFTFANGMVVRRVWQGSGRERTFYAAWTMEQVPVRVVTRHR
jgi:hypothetical protein